MNILVVVYYWPPSAGSGVQRWLKMTKYMQEAGAKMHVLTPANPDFDLKDESLLKDIHPDITVVKTNIWEPYRIARMFTGKKYSNTGTDHAKKSPGIISKLMRQVRARFFIPDPRKFWVKPSVKFLEKYIPEKKIDVVITSGPPHSLHKIGYELKRKIPDLQWVMDVRDPISQMDFFRDLGVEGNIQKKYKDYEKTMLNEADAVVGTSYSLPDYLEQFPHDRYHTIPNGFDKDDFAFAEAGKSGEFIISHAGLFNRYRYGESLWKALKKLSEERQFKVQFAGPVSEEMLEEGRRESELGDRIENLGYISHEEVMKLYHNSSLLLLLANKSEMGTTNVPGKIFELMMSGKPILGFGNPMGDAAQILEKSGCGKVFSYDALPEEIYAFLKTVIGKPQLQRNEEYISQFSRDKLAEKYLKLCKELI